MTDTDLLTDFETARPRLRGLAYRLLGSLSDAEDAVQECFLKWQAADRTAIDNPAAWLTTVCTRHCLDVLKSAQRSRVDYVGPWLPEPLAGTEEGDPEQQVALASSLSLAFLTLLERLTPKERAAYLLREIFDQDYAEVAEIIGATEPNCRKLVSRARDYVKGERPRAVVPVERQQSLLESFLGALGSGDTDRLSSLLSEDIRLTTDGGGKAHAIREPLFGVERIVHFFRVIFINNAGQGRIEMSLLNGAPALIVELDGMVVTALSFDWDDDGRIREILIMRNPDKLERLQGIYQSVGVL
ncbi:RNA polymerase sigma-70 factor [Emcibacter nanhaiensis]|uniref:RNA polymerase sigma-70 factor n=2 Tax=Emcibacter nanhaiensis TaxID=1505037 RepID=A0A501PQ07_9PROT|nr:RNA polymerase sigma-70 factor [Emcibacter nanhaiensis]